ncbi:MAG TPA: ATP synthase subunit I [Gammaproteobacteria bacterium]|nr:ATP synthase subunit I [Gammaproteobacteria bacterium]
MTGRSAIKTNKTAVIRLVQAELALTILAALLLLLLHNSVSARSALAGGLAFVLPNLFFVRQAFRDSGHSTPRVMLLRFYLGEAGKLLFTGLIFIAVFVWIESIHVVALFATYLFMILVHLAGSGIISSQLHKQYDFDNDIENR